MRGYMYILECCDGSFYTGSTKYLYLRLRQHQQGFGANHTKNRLPVKLIYHEVYPTIQEAFYREKQVQRWSRNKKISLVNGDLIAIKKFARSYSKYPPIVVDTSATFPPLLINRSYN